jgi:hypothetical protein
VSTGYKAGNKEAAKIVTDILYRSPTRTEQNGRKYRIVMYKLRRKIVIGYETEICGEWTISHCVGATKDDLKKILEL